MALLHSFHPRLLGPLLRGTATSHTPLELHLFCDDPETLVRLLLERRITYQVGERHWKRYAGGGDYRVYTIQAEGCLAELTLFGMDGLRQAPPCPVDGKAMRRLDRPALEATI